MTLARAFALLAGVAATVPTMARPARAQTAVDQAEAEIRQGTELRYSNQDARALPHFERAYQLSRNPRTAAQLGLVKMALGYCVDAERLLNEALAVPDHPWIARNVTALEQTRENARRNIGEVSVTGTPAGAQVLVNGQAVGTLPLPAPLRLDRGPAELEVRATGYASSARSLKITGGARETVGVALVPTGGAPAAPLAPVATAPRPATATPATATPATAPPATAVGQTFEPPSTPVPEAPAAVAATDSASAEAAGPPLRPLAFAAAGLGAAALVLGVVETVVAQKRADDFNDHTIASPTPADPNRRVHDCETSALSDDCRSIQDAHDRARTLAIVGYVGAGAFAAASAYLFWRAADSATPNVAGGRLGCAPTLATPGLSCRLAF